MNIIRKGQKEHETPSSHDTLNKYTSIWGHESSNIHDTPKIHEAYEAVTNYEVLIWPTTGSSHPLHKECKIKSTVAHEANW